MVIAPETDPAYVQAYTRAGVEIVFRPNEKLFGANESRMPKSETFFSQKNLYKAPEYELRKDGHKWEPCMSAAKTKRGASLRKPVFDIYYHSRLEGQGIREPSVLPYAFVVTVSAPRVQDLYRQTLDVYSEILVPLEPRIEIPIEV